MRKEDFFSVNTILPIVILIAFILGILWLTGDTTPDEVQNPDSWSIGNLESDIELVEYSDFECPACAAAEPTLKKLVATYGDNFKYTYKHFPLTSIHKYSYNFAVSSEAVGVQGKFWEFKDVMFSNQDELFSSENPEEKMKEYVKGIEGIDYDKFITDYESGLFKADVKEDEDEALDLELSYTPSFLLNGQLLDLQSFTELEDILKSAIKNGTANTGATDGITATTSDGEEPKVTVEPGTTEKTTNEPVEQI